MNPNITIRRAERKDNTLILDFIKELAEYEKMTGQVVATEQLLEDWLFEKHVAEVIFAVKDGKEVGFALFFSQFLDIPGQGRNLSRGSFC